MFKQRPLIVFALLMSVSFIIHGQNNPHDTKQLKTSVIIPCHPKHAIQLYALLEEYAQQTVLPDEVVIALSEVNVIAPSLITELKNESWPFQLTIVTSEKKQFAGQNRNIACSHATGDIFICQDADDIPHPQRIEIICYFFEHHGVDHLIHELLPLTKDQQPDFQLFSDFEQIKSRKPVTFKDIWKAGKVTNGNIAISKEVFKKLKWPHNARGQDVYYNQTVYNHFKKRIIVYAPLIYYRQYLSTSRKPHPYLDL